MEAPAALDDEDCLKRDAAMTELNKHQWVLQDPTAKKTFVGKRLASTGNFALLVPTEVDGKPGYMLAPVREWFEFSKKVNYRTLSIDEAEQHLRDMKRKSVAQATHINRKLVLDKNAADAEAIEAKRAQIGK